MTEQLKEAYERALQLPDAEQNAIAERILDEIDNQEWDDLVNQPRSLEAIQRMVRQLRREEAAGETEEGGFDGK